MHRIFSSALYFFLPKVRLAFFVGGALSLLVAAGQARAQQSDNTLPRPLINKTIRSVVDQLRLQGLPFAYSDAVLTNAMVFKSEPRQTDPLAVIRESLVPYNLIISTVGDRYIIGRADDVASTAENAAAETKNEVAAAPALSEIVVAASRYEMMRAELDSPNSLDRSVINKLPDLGDDPIRALQRLPGAAASGASARSHLRGGSLRETGIVLDGHRLLDPFHVRDYQSLFSAINVRAIDSVKVYTGGFPVQYGNLTGGLVLVDTLTPEKPNHTELGISVFNTSLLAAGRSRATNTQWVFSARRGNLDLVLNEDVGEPRYFDIYTKLAYDLTPSTRITASALLVDDSVIAIPSSDPDEREESTNNTRNTQAWLTWEQQWTDKLSSQSLVSMSEFRSARNAFINDPEKIVGDLTDVRNFSMLRLAQDWTYRIAQRHQLQWGAEFQAVDADYTYRSNVDYFGLFDAYVPAAVANSRDLERFTDGDAIAIYMSERWRIKDHFIADIGLRWDKQGYTDATDESQFSPRVGLMYAANKRTSYRLSWGRYYQSQGIHELQVEDGIDSFYPAQRSDHTIFSIQHKLRIDASLRLELYSKSSDRIAPRYENPLDPLTVLPELELDRIRVAPVKSDSRGIELSFSQDISKRYSWWAAYTLSKSEDTIDGRDVPRSWDERHSLKLGGAFNGERWSFAAAAKWHSGWPRTDVLLVTDPVSNAQSIQLGERNAQTFSNFASLDLRADYRQPLRKGSLNWFFEISNATDARNPCCVDFDLDLASDGTLVLEKKDDYWFPLLPAVGVLWEF